MIWKPLGNIEIAPARFQLWDLFSAMNLFLGSFLKSTMPLQKKSKLCHQHVVFAVYVVNFFLILCTIFCVTHCNFSAKENGSVFINDWQIIETFECALSQFWANASTRLHVSISDSYEEKNQEIQYQFFRMASAGIHSLFRWLFFTSTKACSIEIEFKHSNPIDKNWSRQKS